MGIGNAINACAHLNNVANARLGLTSLPATKVNLALALALHRAGFIASLGECIFLMTDQGMMEGREALSRNMGGIVLCRAR
ncbi:hypothetical protein VdG1_03334 [Verticillium dahliae VDG1]|nr:hypothetical protein VdG1_03334 [Verticillium dahliae VDG1]